MNDVILIGYFNEVVELCEKCGLAIIGIVDYECKGNYTYLGDDEKFINVGYRYSEIPLVITPDNPDVREKIFLMYENYGFSFKTVISPDALLSKSSNISTGCMIQSLCNISSDVSLGKGVRVNTGANIMHDSIIGDYSVIAPGAVILGHVSVGNKSYIGANSTILPHIRVGNDAVVGAGAVVTKDVPDGAVVAGVPARIIKYKLK